MSKLKVYVAGAYNDRVRVTSAMADVSGHPRLELAHDWVSIIDESRMDCAEHQLPQDVRVKLSLKDLREAHRSDVFWFLAPVNIGKGCWFESGSVVTAWSMLDQNRRSKKLSIASGFVEQSIFTSLFDSQFQSDEEALNKIVEFFI